MEFEQEEECPCCDESGNTVTMTDAPVTMPYEAVAMVQEAVSHVFGGSTATLIAQPLVERLGALRLGNGCVCCDGGRGGCTTSFAPPGDGRNGVVNWYLGR